MKYWRVLHPIHIFLSKRSRPSPLSQRCGRPGQVDLHLQCSTHGGLPHHQSVLKWPLRYQPLAGPCRPLLLSCRTLRCRNAARTCGPSMGAKASQAPARHLRARHSAPPRSRTGARVRCSNQIRRPSGSPSRHPPLRTSPSSARHVPCLRPLPPPRPRRRRRGGWRSWPCSCKRPPRCGPRRRRRRRSCSPCRGPSQKRQRHDTQKNGVRTQRRTSPTH